MPSYEHKQLIKEIMQLDALPSPQDEFSEWIKAGAHLDFLKKNADSNEVVIYASGEYTYIHTIIVPNSNLDTLNKEDLLNSNCTPYTSIASVVYGGGRSDVWVEKGISSFSSKILKNAVNLVFGRTFEGCDDADASYYELNQEYSHITGIHWRPEHGAYVRFDNNGDIEYTVSISRRKDNLVTLVSFKWEPLEQYLAATNSSLVRIFDFTLLKRGSFSGWSDEVEEKIKESPLFFYKKKIVPGHAAYTHGVQVLPIRLKKEDIFKKMKGEVSGKGVKEHTEFIIHDWRNKKITKVSTAPSETTNYFEAQNNNLPFELSPAFFRPEVLSKYKTDRNKYTVGERDISCRTAWSLKAYDINEAGQIFAYICYLRDLPYTEQQHWASYNEEPKVGISERAIINDFQGELTAFIGPLEKVLGIARLWNEKKVCWWSLGEESLLRNVNVPITASRDEWCEAFMDLSKLVVEGFETREIRKKLIDSNIEYKKEEQSIVLLEKLLNIDKNEIELVGLRTVQKIRSKVKGHSRTHEAKVIEKEALIKHETFKAHFEHICELVAEELQIIEETFGKQKKSCDYNAQPEGRSNLCYSISTSSDKI